MKRGLSAALRSLAALSGMVLLALLGVWVANRWILPHSVGSGSSFSMLPLQGSSREEVYELCAERGLIVSERSAEYDASLPSGYLLRQIPRAGTQVKPGRRITVVFSAGPRMVALPELRGVSERQARLSLEDLGLIPGDVLRCAGAEAAGGVLGSRPGPGTRVPVGGRVDLLLSTGPAGEIYLVPDLRRRNLDAAVALLESSGLPEPRVRYRTARAAAGTILEQLPPAGSRLERGRTLELVVVSGAR